MGEINVDRMLNKITMEQFIYWIAYSHHNGPIDDKRGDAQAAGIRMDDYNRSRSRTQHGKNIDQFMLEFEVKSHSTSSRGWEHNKMMAYMIAGATSR